MNMPPERGPVEPSADMREFAHIMHQMFVALCAEGFTEQQAMGVLGQTIAANMATNRDNDQDGKS